MKKNNNLTTRPNVHIPYDQEILPYHIEVAKLVARYTKESDSVLDIGCGMGFTLAEINKRKPSLELFAADIDSTCLDVTCKRVNIRKTFKVGAVEDLFDAGLAFDAIVMSHVLEHTLRPFDILKGIMQMLNEDGIVVLAVPNPVRPDVFTSNLFKKHYVNRGHVYAWDRSHWMNFLENIVGLKVIQYSQDYIPLPVLYRARFLLPLETWLARFFPWLTFSNIAVVKKTDSKSPK